MMNDFTEFYRNTLNNLNNLVSSGAHLSQSAMQYVSLLSPCVTQEYLVNVASTTISTTAYSTLITSVGIPANTFLARSGLAMGYKIFSTFANPYISQKVEAYTKVHFKMGKIIYDFAQTKFFLPFDEQGNNPIEAEPNKITLHLSDILFNTAFDYAKYSNAIKEGLATVTPVSLLTTGLTNATATQVKDSTIEDLGLTPYLNNYLGKNWISYYYKDWLRGELKNEVEKVKKLFAECSPLTYQDLFSGSLGKWNGDSSSDSKGGDDLNKVDKLDIQEMMTFSPSSQSHQEAVIIANNNQSILSELSVTQEIIQFA